MSCAYPISTPCAAGDLASALIKVSCAVDGTLYKLLLMDVDLLSRRKKECWCMCGSCGRKEELRSSLMCCLDIKGRVCRAMAWIVTVEDCRTVSAYTISRIVYGMTYSQGRFQRLRIGIQNIRFRDTQASCRCP